MNRDEQIKIITDFSTDLQAFFQSALDGKDCAKVIVNVEGALPISIDILAFGKTASKAGWIFKDYLLWLLNNVEGSVGHKFFEDSMQAFLIDQPINVTKDFVGLKK